MNFKANLLQKMAIDKMADDVIKSLKGPDSGAKFDKKSMRRLLEMGPYRHQRERDLDLYILEQGSAKGTILVLDNGLAVYRTTLEDVAMRKSPTVKEMISIRNAIKILNDKDVVQTRRTASVNAVRQVLINQLDLTYGQDDIEELAADGQNALANSYGPGVEEILGLFAELLDLNPLPKAYRANHQDTMGRRQPPPPGGFSAAPVVVYHRIENTLKLLKGPLDTRDTQRMEHYRQMLEGKAAADLTGGEVFAWLKTRVMIENPVIQASSPGGDGK